MGEPAKPSKQTGLKNKPSLRRNLDGPVGCEKFEDPGILGLRVRKLAQFWDIISSHEKPHSDLL